MPTKRKTINVLDHAFLLPLIMRNFPPMPDEFCLKLHALTLNQAIELEIIDDVGDANGSLIISSNNPGIYYAIIQGFAVKCSQRLMQYSDDEIESMKGDLRFFRFNSKRKIHFRLGQSLRTIPMLGFPKIDELIVKKKK